MKFDIQCVLTIEADNGQEAFNKLMDFVAENRIKLTVSIVDDEEFDGLLAGPSLFKGQSDKDCN